MSVKKELVEAISAWLDARPNRNLSMLARMSGMSYSTVRRSAQGEGETSQEAALAIGSLVMSDQVFRKFVSDNWPGLKRFILDVTYPQSSDEELGEFLKSPDHVDLLIIASSGRGLSESYLLQHYGQRRLPHLHDLIDAGFLVNKNGYWVHDAQITTASRDMTREAIGNLARIFDKRNDELPYSSSAYLLWEGLNADAVRELHEATNNYIATVTEVMKDPQKRGEIVYVATAMHNVLKGQEGLV